MDLEDLKNIQVFLQRTPLTGAEAFAWCKASAAVQAEISAKSTPTPPVAQS